MAWRHEIVMRNTLTVKSGNKPNKLIMLMKNLSAMFVALSLAGAPPFIPMGGVQHMLRLRLVKKQELFMIPMESLL